MKYISKGAEPAEFIDWKAKGNDNWQPTYSTLSGDPKKAVKLALMAEQGYICCYCEGRLHYHDSHIEHHQPQSDPTADAIDFSNLLCSCQDRLKKGEPRHCASSRGDWSMPISPLDPSCEVRFAFSADGLIRPAQEDDDEAKETISKLQLHIPKLNSLRSSAIEPFLTEELSLEEFQSFVSGYLRKDDKGQFGEFWTTIRYLFADAIL
jgi:uncharacterized protein (TIGR02646 family)